MKKILEKILVHKTIVKKIAIIIGTIFIIGIIAFNAVLNSVKKVDTSKTRVVINNRNVTLKNEAYIDGEIIYLSKQDIKNFFDKYIYEEETTNKIITTYGRKIAEIGYDSNVAKINGSQKTILTTVKKVGDVIYIPISELKEVYDVEMEYIAGENIVTIDSLSKSKRTTIAKKNLNIKSQPKDLCSTLDKVKKGESLVYVLETKDGWSKVRTEKGIVGYVKTSKLKDITYVREDMNVEKQIEGKVNMFWDYFSESGKAPNREGESYDGVNAVSPAFFYIDENGDFAENVGTAGKNYISWAHENGYKVWPMLSNALAGIDVTSEILNDYEKRQNLIEDIIKACVEYGIDGINVDFENMKKEDINVYSRFIIELEPRLKEIGLVLSVDVTAPDGSETWSFCYDRLVLGEVADYLIFMAYDQNGTGSKEAGTVAGYNWIETSVKKFVTTYEVEPEKLILGLPFYTRIWTLDSDGNLEGSAVVNMKDVEKNIPAGVEKEWNDTLKQNYVEFTSRKNTKKMWIEDLESIKAKLNLVKEYNLGGVAAWEKDREDEGVWDLIKTELKNNEPNENVEE